MSLRRRWFARFYDRLQAGYEKELGQRRPELLGGIAGRVLELGPGTGINLEHLDRTAGAVQWHGVEPNPHMRDLLVPRAKGLGFEPRFCELDGSRIAAQNASFDVVLSTLVLCSVPDVDATLAEVRRVLKPGGRFVFLEHVGAERGSWERRAQRALRPCWRFFADGCNLDRDLARNLEGAGFATLELERFRARLPHVMGSARA